MIAIRITGPGLNLTLGVESLDDMKIVEVAMLRVRERLAISPTTAALLAKHPDLLTPVENPPDALIKRGGPFDFEDEMKRGTQDSDRCIECGKKGDHYDDCPTLPGEALP